MRTENDLIVSNLRWKIVVKLQVPFRFSFYFLFWGPRHVDFKYLTNMV